MTPPAAATIIASQALITGVFSLTHQAVHLGLFPRVTVAHTSREAEGQICVPEMNWALCILCVALVIAFKESARLAAAYGVAVSGNRPLRGLCASQLTLPLHRGAPETGQARSPRSAGRASFMWRKWLQAAFRDARRG